MDCSFVAEQVYKFQREVTRPQCNKVTKHVRYVKNKTEKMHYSKYYTTLQKTQSIVKHGKVNA